MTVPITLPWPLQSSLEAATQALFDRGDQSSVDFLRPAGEAALVSPDSVSWRVFKNPLSLFIGGVNVIFNLGRGVGGFGPFVVATVAVAYSFTVAIALLAIIYLVDILATALLIPEKKGAPLE